MDTRILGQAPKDLMAQHVDVAQLMEHRFAKSKVASLNLAIHTKPHKREVNRGRSGRGALSYRPSRRAGAEPVATGKDDVGVAPDPRSIVNGTLACSG